MFSVHNALAGFSMPLLNYYLLYALLAYLGWKAIWLLFYVATGFRISSITINNGILVNGIKLSSKKLDLEALSVRLRLWGNSRQLIVDDVRICLKDIMSSKNSTKSNVSSHKMEDEGPDIPFEDPRVSIYPHNRYIAATIRAVLSRFPHIDIEIRNSELITERNGVTKQFGSISVDYLRLTQTSKYAEMNNDNLKFHTMLVLNNTSTLSLHAGSSKCWEKSERSSNELNDDSNAPLSCDVFKVNVRWQVSLDQGVISGVVIKSSVNRIRILAFGLIKIFLGYDNALNLKNQVEMDLRKYPKQDKLQPGTAYVKFKQRYLKFQSTVEEVSFHLANTKIVDIPLTSFDDNESFDSYFAAAKPVTSVEFMTRSISFDYSKIDSKTPGYQILFDPIENIATQLTLTTQLIAVNFISSKKVNGRTIQFNNEILNVPNTSISYKSNFLQYLANGSDLKDCVTELFISASSPILDLDSHIFAALFNNMHIINKFMKWKRSFVNEAANKSAKTDISDARSSPQPQIDSESEATVIGEDPVLTNKSSPEGLDDNKITTKKKLLSLIHKFYPKIEVKMTIEQPRTIIQYENQERHCVEMVNFSYSHLDMHIITTTNSEYECLVNVLKPVVSYIEKSIVTTEKESQNILSNILEVESLKFSMNVFKKFKIVPSVNFNSINVNFSDLKVLRGISNILHNLNNTVGLALTTGVLNLKLNELLEERVKLDPQAFAKYNKLTPVKEKIFKQLPFWLLEASVNINKIDICIGSRSIFLSPDDLALGKENYEIRKVHISVENVTLLLSDEDDIDNYYNLKFQTTGISLKNNNEPFLEVPVIEFSCAVMNQGHKKVIKVDGNVDTINAYYDKFNLFTVLGSVYVIREIVLVPLKEMKEKWVKDRNVITKNKQKQKDSVLDFILLLVDIKSVILEALLNEEFNSKFQIISTTVTLENKIVFIEHVLARFFGASPTVPGKWTRFLCVDKTKYTIDKNAENLVEIDSKGIRIMQTHNFVVYHLFDNLGITVKTIKHLVATLLGKTGQSMLVGPKPMKPPKIPNIHLVLRTISFTMQDDPFESELSMIYQLGLVEQRKRLELLHLFNNQADRKDKDYSEKKYRLWNTISDSWIRKVNVFKSTLEEEIVKHKRFLFGNEITIDPVYNEDVLGNLKQPPLTSIYLEQVDALVCSSKENVPELINSLGQGVPVETKYSTLVPLHLSLKMQEFRMHLRDYPLPLLHVPSNMDGSNAFFTKGNLFIAEELVTAEENLRRLKIPLIRDSDYCMHIDKSLATVKIYSDLRFHFNGRNATRFVWGQSYQFALQQMTLNFDQFSKPPIDCSPKLGIWDKLKFIIHGNFKILVADESSLHVAIKGSRDPYQLTGNASGFVLGFKNNVEWNVNEDDDSRSLFKVSADQVSFFIPNFLAEPLVSWIRPTTKLTFLPKAKNLVTSLFAYYLEDVPDAPIDVYSDSSRINEKTVLQLKGGVQFKVGFLLQRKKTPNNGLNDDSSGQSADDSHKIIDISKVRDDDLEDNEESSKISDISKEVDDNSENSNDEFSNSVHDCLDQSNDKFTLDAIPHYKIKLYDPKYVDEGHDSYRGFRSEFIHMVISLSSNTEKSKNAIYLTPEVFSHIFGWWKLFAGNLMVPVRRGPMFGELKSSQKFSQHLFSNKFDFNFKAFTISHIHKVKNLSSDKDFTTLQSENGIPGEEKDVVEFVGLKARVDSFVLDLHQRREPQYHSDDKESANKEISKMVFNIGECHFLSIDLRTVTTLFDKLAKNSSKSEKSKWFDALDYQNVFEPSLADYKPKFKCHSFIFTESFSYHRNNHLSIDEFHKGLGQEKIHECLLGKLDLYANVWKLYDARIKHLQKTLKDKKELKKRVDILQNAFQDLNKNAALNEFEGFQNKFLLICPIVKWNVNIKDNLLRYFTAVEYQTNARKFLSHETVSVLEDMIDQELKDDIATDAMSKIETAGKTSIDIREDDEESSQKRIAKFEEILNRVTKDDQKIKHDYLLKVISPQIQFMSDENPETVMLVTTLSIDVKTVMVNAMEESSSGKSRVAQELIQRYGILVKEANVLLLHQKDEHSDSIWMMGRDESKWPPWVGEEVCEDSSLIGVQNVIVQKTSFMVTLDKLKSKPRVEDEGETFNKIVGSILRVDIPKVVVSCTSKQYMSLYMIALDTLLFQPVSADIANKLEKLKLSIDMQDLSSLKQKIKSLREYYNLLTYLEDSFKFRQDYLDNEGWNEYDAITSEKEVTLEEIFLLLYSVLQGEGQHSVETNKAVANWTIGADEIIVHMISEDRQPILDLALAKGRCRREINEDGSNLNRVEVSMMQVFNLLPKAEHPILFEPFSQETEGGSGEKEKNMIMVDWKMNRPVGGIKFIELFKVDAKPLKLKIDDYTGKKIMEYIFGKGNNISESPIITRAKLKELDADEDDDDADEDEESTESEAFSDASDSTAPSSTGLTVAKRPESSKETGTATESHTKLSTSKSLKIHGAKNVDEMYKRSKNFISIGKFQIPSLIVEVSIKCRSGIWRILNVQNFLILLPKFTIDRMVVTMLDITMMFKKFVIKALLGHTGLLLRNKISSRRNHNRKKRKTPLQPVKQYATQILSLELLQQSPRHRQLSLVTTGTANGTVATSVKRNDDDR